MKVGRPSAVLVVLVLSLTGCSVDAGDIDPHLSLPDAKKRTQAIERDIAEALPADLVVEIEQNETGSFLACTRNGGEQWAGGLSAHVYAGTSAQRLLDPVERRFARTQDLVVTRWESDGDSIIELAGAHQSSWIIRYDPGRGEVHVSSFSPCIYLPDDVWRGDTY